MKRDIRIDIDPDFIDSPRHNNSLCKLIEEWPNGAPSHLIKKVLRISQEELDSIYERAIIKLRSRINPDE